MSGSVTASILAFVAVAAVLVVTPGVGTAYLTSTVIGDGKRAGYLAVFGMVLGSAIHAVAAALGTAILLRAFPSAIDWIAILGGSYISVLGVRGIIRAVRPPQRDGRTPVPARPSTVGSGVIIALGNAPLPLFYLVVVPQYVPRAMSRIAGVMLLSLIHLAMAATWMTTLVTLLGRLASVLRRPRVHLTLQVLTGLALLYLGVKSASTAVLHRLQPTAYSG